MKLKPAALIFAICLAIASGLIVLTHTYSTKSNQFATAEEGFTQPSPGGPLSVQIKTDKRSYLYGEQVVFTSLIHNTSEQPETYTFNSTCTDGTLFIDGIATQLIKACGMAMTDVSLQPGEKIYYDYKFELVENLSGRSTEESIIDYEGELALKPGNHAAYVDWQNTKSQLVKFQIDR